MTKAQRILRSNAGTTIVGAGSLSRPGDSARPERLRRFLGRLRDYGTFLRHSWRRDSADGARPAAVALVCGDGDRGYVFRGKLYSQLLDSLGDQLGKAGVSVMTIASPFSRVPERRAFGRVVAANGRFARAGLADSLGKLVGLRTGVIRENTVRAWQELIRKVKPAAVLAIQPNPELCIAAKRTGTWIVDVQHGVVAGDPYYDPSRCTAWGDQAWPNAVLCWDASSASAIEKELGGRVRTVVVGNPWFSRFAEPDPGDSLVSDAVESFVSSLASNQSTAPVVLVTLQWGMSERPDYHPVGTPRELVEMIIRAGNAYQWWLRIHPVMMQAERRREYLRLLDRTFGGLENVLWTTCSEAPLSLVLPRCSAHVTSHSAVTIEAAWYGVPTALLDTRGSVLTRYFSEQLEKGLAEVVPPEQDSILRWLAENTQSASRRPRSEAVSAEALQRFVDDIRSRATSSALRQERQT